jgi:hypothetical protein
MRNQPLSSPMAKPLGKCLNRALLKKQEICLSLSKIWDKIRYIYIYIYINNSSSLVDWSIAKPKLHKVELPWTMQIFWSNKAHVYQWLQWIFALVWVNFPRKAKGVLHLWTSQDKLGRVDIFVELPSESKMGKKLYPMIYFGGQKWTLAKRPSSMFLGTYKHW